MGRVGLQYNFELPEDAYDYETILMAKKSRSFLEELDSGLRNIDKYEADTLFGEPFKDAGDLAAIIRINIPRGEEA